MPYQQILQKYAYQGIFACRIHICDETSSKSYDFHEKCKVMENLIILVISVNFLRFSQKLLSRVSEKVRKYVFLEKKTNKAKLEFSRESQFYRKYDKIGGNFALSSNSTKICLLGYFCMQNSYLR